MGWLFKQQQAGEPGTTGNTIPNGNGTMLVQPNATMIPQPPGLEQCLGQYPLSNQLTCGLCPDPSPIPKIAEPTDLIGFDPLFTPSKADATVAALRELGYEEQAAAVKANEASKKKVFPTHAPYMASTRECADRIEGA